MASVDGIDENSKCSPSEEQHDILHAGRLGSFTPDAASYTSSVDIDHRLVGAVVSINRAHVVMLVEREVINLRVGSELLNALAKVPRDGLRMKTFLEDVHMNVEDYVTSLAGREIGGMLNVGKSRNDQVATAIRMALRNEIISLARKIVLLELSLLDQASDHVYSFMPGYTHLQRGQPVTLAHALLAHFDAVDRNFRRLMSCYLQTNVCPMGAGALASTGFDIDRERVTELLGFDSILENSIDAVSSRDFAAEAVFACAQLMTDLSSLAEQIILWTAKEFSFAEISDEFASTSSMMPQKKNAVVPEVLRARTSQVLGDLVGCLGILKSLPQGYNLDLQELTRNLWSATDKASFSTQILSDTVRTTKFNLEAMLAAAREDEFLYATEIADYLVHRFSVPFREAHRRVGALVKLRHDSGITREQFTGLSEEELSNALGVKVTREEITSLVDPKKVLLRRKALGSPNPELVRAAIEKRKLLVSQHKAVLTSLEAKLLDAQRMLDSAADKIRIGWRSGTAEDSSTTRKGNEGKTAEVRK